MTSTKPKTCATRTVKFHLTIDLNLVEDMEFKPLFCIYPSGGIRPAHSEPQCVFTDTYQSRLASGTSIGNVGSRHRSLRCTTRTCTSRHEIDVDLALDLSGRVSPDEAICVQAYCELECEDGEWGCHACGWGAVTIDQLVSCDGHHRVTALLCDQGQTASGSRGSFHVNTVDPRALASVALGDENPATAVATRRTGWFSGGRPTRTTAASESMGRYAAATEEVCKMDTVSTAVPLTTLPRYSTCGGCVVRPSIAFLMTKQPQGRSEDYFLRAFGCAMARRMPDAAGDGERLSAFMRRTGSRSDLDANERGGVLMETATMLASECSYLFDLTLEDRPVRLEPGEDFSRRANFTMTLDCEDAAYDAVSCLWDVLVGEWRSEVMREMQSVRAQYLATVALKSVTRSSASFASSHLIGGGLCGHDSCDLVPVHVMLEMIKRSGCRSLAIERIAAKRKLDAAANSVLSVVVGEGTGRVVSFSRMSTQPRFPKTRVGRHFTAVVQSASLVSHEDHRADTAFFRYVISAIVHDTLLESREAGVHATWDTPQVTYMTLGDRAMTTTRRRLVGVDHAVYCGNHQGTMREDGTPHRGPPPRSRSAAEWDSVIAVPVENPSVQVMDAMEALEKYEVPEVAPLDPPQAPPGSATVKGFDFVVSETRKLDGRLRSRSSKMPLDLSNACVVVPLVRLNAASLNEIFKRLESDDCVYSIRASLEHVVDGMHFVMFSIVAGVR